MKACSRRCRLLSYKDRVIGSDAPQHERARGVPAALPKYDCKSATLASEETSTAVRWLSKVEHKRPAPTQSARISRHGSRELGQMKDLHIAIVNQPNPAHVNPTLSVVETLVRRGYRVTYVTSERYAAEITRLGAEVLVGPRFEFPFKQPNDPHVPIGKQHSPDLIDLAVRTVTVALPFYQRHVPDLILFDTSALAGLVLAERLSVPRIRMTPGLTYEKEYVDHPSFPTEFREFMNGFSDKVDAFCRSQGIPRRGALYIGDEPALHFYLRELRLIQLEQRRSHLHAARCAAERPYVNKWQGARRAGKRSVLISASTVYEQGPAYYRLCMEALRELQLHCVLAVGIGIDIAAFGTLPDDCEIVQGLPQIALMPHVDVIVCLGGMTTVMEALYHGLPLVMITHGKAHAELYANNVESHGLGIHLKGPEPNAAAVKNCVARILGDAAMGERIKQAQRRVKSAAGGEEVANWIEQQLEQYRKTSRSATERQELPPFPNNP